MLRGLKDIERYSVSATDGELGEVIDFLVDDEQWTVRFLIVDIGDLGGEHRVLIAPAAFRKADWATQRFHLAMTKELLRTSPVVDLTQPVSREQEKAYYRQFGYPKYWESAGLWGSSADPVVLQESGEKGGPLKPEAEVEGPHLRSIKEVRGYQLQGSNGPLGTVEDFIADDGTWEIRYLVLDTSSWWFTKRVLIAPGWATGVSWEERKVFVNISQEGIKASPAWDASAPISREYEERLYDYHGRPLYWAGPERVGEAPGLPLVAGPPAQSPQ